MGSKSVIMHNLIKIYHVFQGLCAFSLTDHGLTDERVDSHMFLFIFKCLIE